MYCEETARRNAREINDIWHGLRYYCPACGRQVAVDPDNYGEVHHCPDCEDEELEEYEETPDDEDEALEEDNAENDAYASEQVSAEDLDL